MFIHKYIRNFLLLMLFVISTTMFADKAMSGSYRGDILHLDTAMFFPSRCYVEGKIVLGEFLGRPVLAQGWVHDVLEEDHLDKGFHLSLGLGFQRGQLKIQPTLGYSFTDRGPVGTCRFYSEVRLWFWYSSLEYRFKSHSFYNLTQLERKIKLFNLSALLGFEFETWGDIDDKLISPGVGVNGTLIFHPVRGDKESKFLLQFAVQCREMDNNLKGQIIARLIFQPNIKDNTPERKGRRRR